MSGHFITFEGIEGSGKSTQLAMAAQALRARGRDVVTTREPGGTALGDAIRTLLLDPTQTAMHPLTEALLYAASRAQHVAEVIAPALARGVVVLCDRYADATTAYQGAARGLSDACIQTLHGIATQQTWPQLTLLFDLPVAVGLARAHGRATPPDRIEQETRDFHEHVREAYRALAAREPTRVQLIDSTPSANSIHTLVMQWIDRYVE
ncbi:MAG: dTMP kinase [Deltaproteobacteria bacterium]|nr:dTMP kinase [Deltaproteobacteria bacterium]